MPVYKDKNRNTWYTSFYYTDWQGNRKKKKKEGFELQRDAKEFEKEFIKQYAGSCDMTFSSMAELYLRDCKTRLKPTTYLNRVLLINTKLVPYFCNKSLNQITASDIRQWQNTLIGNNKDYSQTYLKTIHNQTSALFNFAVKYYNLKSNPARQCGSMGQKHVDNMQFWTLDQFKKFLAVVSDKPAFKAIFNLLFWTGIRVGELLALTLDDFDFESMELNICKNYARFDSTDLIMTPKTKKSTRKISIMPFLQDDIKNYISTLYDYKSSKRLFSHSKYFLTKEILRGCEAAGIPRIRIHDLRHSHASLLIELGYSPLLISERLGHESIETTLQTYSHLYPNKQKDMASRLQDLQIK